METTKECNNYAPEACTMENVVQASNLYQYINWDQDTAKGMFD
jgi:hypothetical protein